MNQPSISSVGTTTNWHLGNWCLACVRCCSKQSPPEWWPCPARLKINDLRSPSHGSNSSTRFSDFFVGKCVGNTLEKIENCVSIGKSFPWYKKDWEMVLIFMISLWHRVENLKKYLYLCAPGSWHSYGKCSSVDDLPWFTYNKWWFSIAKS